jgi:hypothetical protein
MALERVHEAVRARVGAGAPDPTLERSSSPAQKSPA